MSLKRLDGDARASSRLRVTPRPPMRPSSPPETVAFTPPAIGQPVISYNEHHRLLSSLHHQRYWLLLRTSGGKWVRQLNFRYFQLCKSNSSWLWRKVTQQKYFITHLCPPPKKKFMILLHYFSQIYQNIWGHRWKTIPEILSVKSKDYERKLKHVTRIYRSRNVSIKRSKCYGNKVRIFHEKQM